MATREYNPEFNESSYDYSYEDRGLLKRAIDELRSWFGDEQAEVRRRLDYRSSEMRNREERYEHSRFDIDNVRVHEIMTRSVITVQPDDSVEHAAQLMDNGIA
jgi:CBS domain-containing protein